MRAATTLTDNPPIRNRNALLAATLILVALAAAGCAAKDRSTTSAGHDPARTAGRQSPQILLDEGYRALENQQYNEAIAKADAAFSAAAPHGAGTPEALYLKGRSFEAKNAAGVTEDQATANLQAAREAYIKALGENRQGDIVYRAIVVPQQADARLRWNMTASAAISPSSKAAGAQP